MKRIVVRCVCRETLVRGAYVERTCKLPATTQRTLRARGADRAVGKEQKDEEETVER